MTSLAIYYDSLFRTCCSIRAKAMCHSEAQGHQGNGSEQTRCGSGVHGGARMFAKLPKENDGKFLKSLGERIDWVYTRCSCGC